MLADFAMLQPVQEQASELVSASVYVPTGLSDDDWMHCGWVKAKRSQEGIQSLEVEIGASFIEQLESPIDDELVADELTQLLLVVLYQFQELAGVVLAGDIAVVFRSPLSRSDLIFKSGPQLLVPA